MAAPLASRKQSVSLGSPGPAGSGTVRVSRIRRDPPPPVKPIALVDPEDRDARTVVVGVLMFTLALLVIGIAISGWLGWSPRDHVAHF